MKGSQKKSFCPSSLLSPLFGRVRSTGAATQATCARLSPDLGPSQPTEVLNHSGHLPCPMIFVPSGSSKTPEPSCPLCFLQNQSWRRSVGSTMARAEPRPGAADAASRAICASGWRARGWKNKQGRGVGTWRLAGGWKEVYNVAREGNKGRSPARSPRSDPRPTPLSRGAPGPLL